MTLDSDIREGVVVFGMHSGAKAQAELLHLKPQAATFGLYSPDAVVRISEVLAGFSIRVREKVIYTGRAVVCHVVHSGTGLLCEVSLDDEGFTPELLATTHVGEVAEQFRNTLRRWEYVPQVRPEFKVVMADIITFLLDLQHWLERVEVGLRRTCPAPDQPLRERGIIDALKPEVLSTLNTVFERFENVVARLREEELPAHRVYAQRQFHPIVLCSPFAHRTFSKPLGYAGDYEMVNMMLRDPSEGPSLFAKLFNIWLLSQKSAAAHRNRIAYLTGLLVQETASAMRAGRNARILNLGCGPAQEVLDFIEQGKLATHAELTLLDFNDETIAHAECTLRAKVARTGQGPAMEFVKKSVQQVLKDAVRFNALSASRRYDLVYCAGLFDYLPDRTCRHLMTVFHQSVVPGGLVVATNVAPLSPNKGSLELGLDWHLIYRTVDQMRGIAPDGAAPDAVRVLADDTGVNYFLEVRKPNAT